VGDIKRQKELSSQTVGPRIQGGANGTVAISRYNNLPEGMHKAVSGQLRLIGTVLITGMLGAQSFAPASPSTEFVHGHEIVSSSPLPSARVVMVPAKDENDDPIIVAWKGAHSLNLGPLRRSADLYWSATGDTAILIDRAYSNENFVRIIQFRSSKPYELKSFDARVRHLVGMSQRDLIHYWLYMVGWSENSDFLLTACVDWYPSGTAEGKPLLHKEVTLRGSLNGALSPSTMFLAKKVNGRNPCD
jgi:hypothetical protein